MKSFFTIVICFLTYISFGQDTTYYNTEAKEVNSSELYTYYEVISRNHYDTNSVKVTSYFKSKQKRSAKNYSVYKDEILDGKQYEWFESGQLRSEINYRYGKLNGNLLLYWENGNPKRIDNYDNDKLIAGKCFGLKGTDTTFFKYEESPMFIGDEEGLLQYLSNTVKYPNNSNQRGIQGKVVVRFTIKEDGSIANIKIVESVNDELDKEVIRVIKKMPKWRPAKRDGEPVETSFTFPINFIKE